MLVWWPFLVQSTPVGSPGLSEHADGSSLFLRLYISPPIGSMTSWFSCFLSLLQFLLFILLHLRMPALSSFEHAQLSFIVSSFRSRNLLRILSEMILPWRLCNSKQRWPGEAFWDLTFYLSLSCRSHRICFIYLVGRNPFSFKDTSLRLKTKTVLGSVNFVF